MATIAMNDSAPSADEPSDNADLIAERASAHFRSSLDLC